MQLLPTSMLPISTYFIKDTCALKIGNQEYETILTYTLFIESGKGTAYHTSIQRTDFKVNSQEIDTKYLRISNRYMEALFPIECRIKNYRLQVSNIDEIENNIKKIDQEMLNTYQGEGLEHIRSSFLEATNTEYKLREFIKQLHIMKILNLGMQKFERSKTYEMSWNTMPIDKTVWCGEMKYNENLNKLIFEPKIQNAQEFMNNIIRYIHKYDYDVKIEQKNLPIFADFYHKSEYTGETGRMKHSETNICIDIENVFFYEQKITLKTI